MPKLDQPLLFTPAPLPTAELSADERLACLRLIRSENVGPVTFRELINRFGGAAHALQALPDLSRRGGSSRAIQLYPKADAEKELETAERAGAVPVFTIEPDYPALLARIEAPPPMVYVKGRRELLSRPAVAIVGSRQCSAAGVQVTRQFASELAEAGFVIVSGLARGIDRAAHEAALARGTVAVLAGGIDGFIRPSTPSFSAGSAAKAVSSRSGRRASNLEKRIFRGETGPLLAWCMASSSSKRQCHRERSSPPAMPTRTRGVRASRSSSRSARRRHRLIKSGATFVTAPEDIVEALHPIIGLDEHRAD